MGPVLILMGDWCALLKPTPNRTKTALATLGRGMEMNGDNLPAPDQREKKKTALARGGLMGDPNGVTPMVTPMATDPNGDA